MEIFKTWGLPLLGGFAWTLILSVVAGLMATVVGVLLAAMRVSPVPVLRGTGTVYVNAMRNTPLTLIILGIGVVLPVLDIHLTQFEFIKFGTWFIADAWFVYAAVAIGLYTAAFICEAVRSGINAVPPGQAEAARAVGMTFGQNLRMIILPQALRTVLPPLASIYIAMTKNTSIAAFFGNKEATKIFDDLARDDPTLLYQGFAVSALGYVIITLSISGFFHVMERRMAVAR